jgi:hypothetical protein
VPEWVLEQCPEITAPQPGKPPAAPSRPGSPVAGPKPRSAQATSKPPAPDNVIELSPDAELYEPPKKRGALTLVLVSLLSLLLVGGGIGAAAFLGYLPKDWSIAKLRGRATEPQPDGFEPFPEPPDVVEPAPPSAAKPLDLSYIAADFNGAMIVRPARLAKAPLLAGISQDQLLAEPIKQIGVDPRKIEQAILLVEPFPGGIPKPNEPSQGNVLFFPAGILRFAEGVDCKPMLNKVLEDPAEATFQGKKYFKSATVKMAQTPMCGYAPDPRTLLLAPEPTLQKMLGASNVKTGLVERLRQVDLNHDVVAVFVLEPPLLREAVGEALKSAKDALPPDLAEAANLHKHLQSVTVTLDLSGDTLMKVVFEAPSADSAKVLHNLLAKAHEMGKQQYAEARKGLVQELKNGALPEQVGDAVLAVADQVVAGVSVSQEGTTVSARLGTPKGLAGAIEKLAALLKPRDASAPPAPDPLLRQIGIAYANYLDTFNEPPAKANDFATFVENDKRILNPLESGEIVFIFNAGPKEMTDGPGKTVLAYFKEVPTKGGWVLMGDGKTVQMTAEEFKKAKVAKPKVK